MSFIVNINFNKQQRIKVLQCYVKITKIDNKIVQQNILNGSAVQKRLRDSSKYVNCFFGTLKSF